MNCPCWDFLTRSNTDADDVSNLTTDSLHRLKSKYRHDFKNSSTNPSQTPSRDYLEPLIFDEDEKEKETDVTLTQQAYNKFKSDLNKLKSEFKYYINYPDIKERFFYYDEVGMNQSKQVYESFIDTLADTYRPRLENLGVQGSYGPNDINIPPNHIVLINNSSYAARIYVRQVLEPPSTSSLLANVFGSLTVTTPTVSVAGSLGTKTDSEASSQRSDSIVSYSGQPRDQEIYRGPISQGIVYVGSPLCEIEPFVENDGKMKKLHKRILESRSSWTLSQKQADALFGRKYE
jgi:hypothetical protein